MILCSVLILVEQLTGLQYILAYPGSFVSMGSIGQLIAAETLLVGAAAVSALHFGKHVCKPW